MKKLFIALLILLASVWGCAHIENIMNNLADNAEKGLIVTDIAHEATVGLAQYLRRQGKLTNEEWQKIVGIDANYHILHKIIKDAIIALRLAQEYENQENIEKKKDALNNAIIEFIKVALELNDFICDLKAEKTGKGAPI